MKSFLPILLLALSQVVLIQADYTIIDPSDYNSNPQILKSLNFGGEHIIQLGVQRSVLPEDEYHIASVSQIEQNLLVNGVNHRFNVNILSEEGVKVAAVYAVYHRYSTGANKVVSYQYNYTFPNSLNSTQEFSWEDYDFDGDEGETEIEVPTEETEVEIPTEETEVEIPTEETEVEIPTEETEVEIPNEETEVEIPTEETEVEVPTEETETEVPTEVEIPSEEEVTEVEIPSEEETETPTEVEIPSEEETEVEIPSEEETEVEVPTEEEGEGEVPNGEDGEDGGEDGGEGEGEGDGEGELPDGNEEWICEEEEVVIPPPTEEETELPVDEWPNEWVEVCEEEQGEGEVVVLN